MVKSYLVKWKEKGRVREKRFNTEREAKRFIIKKTKLNQIDQHSLEVFQMVVI
ncbi:MAG: hypothetical protein ACOCV1_01595 [Bacillota bacterium]